MTKLTIDGYQNKKENKYYFFYRNLIIKRMKNPILNEEYKELHHILPRSLGGDKKEENLVYLLPREHYIAHLCLVKFIKGQGYYKMLCAIAAMSMKTLKATTYNSRLYDILQCKRKRELSLWLKKHSPFKDKTTHQKSINTREKNRTNVWITNNPMKNPVRAKEIASTRAGKNHYLVKNTQYEFSKDNGITWIKLEPSLTIKEICQKNNWSTSTFNCILKGRIFKKGNMAYIRIRKITNENN